MITFVIGIAVGTFIGAVVAAIILDRVMASIVGGWR